MISGDTSTVRVRWTKLPFVFDSEELRREVISLPEDSWISHFNAADFEGKWSSISLRSKSGRSDDIIPLGEVSEFRDTPLLDFCPHLRSVISTFAFPLKAVRLLRLHAGSQVKEHSDRDLGLADGELRVHVPIITSEKVEFIVANRRLFLREGESWFIDFSQPHRIYNAGTDDRVHLVIDGTLNDWAQELLLRSCREIVTEAFLPAGLEEFEKFRNLVYVDSTLRDELMRQPNAKALVDCVLTAAKRLGVHLKRADLESVLNANRRSWTMRSTF